MLSKTIKANLTVCPICHFKILYRTSVYYVDGSPDPVITHFFECNSAPSDETHFILFVTDDNADTFSIDWEDMSFFQADVYPNETLVLQQVLELCQKYSGLELAEKIKSKMETAITFE